MIWPRNIYVLVIYFISDFNCVFCARGETIFCPLILSFFSAEMPNGRTFVAFSLLLLHNVHVIRACDLVTSIYISSRILSFFFQDGNIIWAPTAHAFCSKVFWVGPR